MRILQVCLGYFPAIGEVEQHVRNISERLAREHEVTVFAADPSGRLPKEIYNLYTSGKSIVYSPPQNTWDEVARQYEDIIDRLVSEK